jgi:hypothetical protein
MKKQVITLSLILFLTSMIIPATASADRNYCYCYHGYYRSSDPYYGYYNYYGSYYRYPFSYYGYSPYFGYSSACVRAVQRILREEGLYYGPINGILGPRTRSALRAYQRRYDLRVTGRLDIPTLRSMGLI